MKRVLSFIAILIAFANAAIEEPSAFSAGDLDSSNPYGLTKTEKQILQNKRAVESIQKTLLKQQQIVQRNSERIDGLQSIIEGMSKKIKSSEKIDELNRTVEELKSSNAALQRSQEENFEQIKTVLSEMASLIDSINEKYVDKERFEKLESAFLKFKESYDSYIKKSDLSGKPNSKIFKEAKELFKNSRYGDAKIYFKHLIKNHYKPATSNFYLGEIAFKEGRYKDAIAYYKKSASLYDKSKFMPRLLLNTAASLSYTGEKKQAREFYESLISLYPDSKEANIARKRLSKL